MRRRGTGVAVAAAIVSLCCVAQSGVATNASWVDSEFAHGTTSTVNCTNPTGAFATRGEGRILSGSALGLDTASLADVTGVRASNNGNGSTVRPTSASPVITTPAQPDAYADPLNLSLLGGTVPLDATGVLQLPVSTPTGLIAQYGQARSTGDAAGASGYLTDHGGVNTSGASAGYPNLATLRLSTLLNSLGYNLGTAVGDSTLDVALEIGAVAGRAAFEDPCSAIWAGTPLQALKRDYLAAGLATVLDSQVVRTVSTTATSTVTTLQNTANGLVGSQSVLSGITGTVATTVGGVLNLISGLTRVRVKNNATTALITAINLNLAPVNSLISAPITDPDHILSVSLAQGTVRIDTGALLAKAYGTAPGNRLNGLAPNFNPLADPNMLAVLNTALGAALANWVTVVDTELKNALDGAVITVAVTVPLESCVDNALGLLCLLGSGNWHDAGAISVGLSGSLLGLLAGNVTPTVDLSGLGLGPVGTLVGALLSNLISALKPVLGPAVGGVVDGLLRPLAKLPSTIIAPVVPLVSSVYTTLFLNGAVAVTVNAQNDPQSGKPEPQDWVALPAGRYDVAAMRIGVLDAAAANAVWLYLGRGSVGPVCSRARPAACAGY